MKTHLTQRRVSLAGFLTGVLAGGLAYLAFERHEIAFVCFVTAWYLLAYGALRVIGHPEHRPDWLTHIALFPAAWVAAVILIQLWLGNLLAGVLLGAIVAVAVQSAATTVALRRVRDDQRSDLRKKLGIG